MRVLIIFLKIAKNGEAAGVRKKIKLRVESVKRLLSPLKGNGNKEITHLISRRLSPTMRF